MTVMCCTHCYQNICKKDSYAGSVWVDLCKYFVNFAGIFKMDESKLPKTLGRLRKLEVLGFISTMDGDNGVSVRVNGYEALEYEDDYLDTFCIDRINHAESLKHNGQPEGCPLN